MNKTILIVVSVLLNAIFIPAFIVDYKAKQQEPNAPEYTFIWNDDEESIPMDGTKVIIEMTKGNTIYLSNVE